jgi:preprotein translocase subunit SecA
MRKNHKILENKVLQKKIEEFNTDSDSMIMRDPMQKYQKEGKDVFKNVTLSLTNLVSKNVCKLTLNHCNQMP